MKFSIKYYYLFLISLFLTTTGCINDYYPDTPCSEEKGERTVGYMAIRLRTSDAATRAQEFDTGGAGELAISPDLFHYAIFYNEEEQKAPLAVASLNDLVKKDVETPNNNYSMVLATVTAKEDKDGPGLLKKLKECFVVLNSEIKKEELLTKSKEELLEMCVANPVKRDKNGNVFFTTSNAVCLDNGKIKVSAEVNTDYFYDSYMEAVEQAWKSDGKVAIEAYVERMAAKFSFEFGEPSTANVYEAPEVIDRKVILFERFDKNSIPVYEKEKYSYKVRFTGWEMSGREKCNYLFRKISAGGNYFADWNDTANKRCYWSEDPNYGDGQYPHQYRPAYDNTSVISYEMLENRNENLLQNFTYNQIVAAADNFNRNINYTPENTFDRNTPALKERYGERMDLLVGTHLILTAELLTNINGDTDGDGDPFEPNDVYRDRRGNLYRTEKDCFKALVVAFNKALESQSEMAFHALNWTEYGGAVWRDREMIDCQGGNYALFYNGVELTEQYINSLPDNMGFSIQANVEGGDGKRIIWLDGITILDRTTKQPPKIIDKIVAKPDKPVDEKYYRAEAITTDEMRSVMYEWMGCIAHFNNGRMYYAVPVYHRVDDGICGVVRNHSYSFVFDSVSRIGTPVDNPDESIVPEVLFTNDEVNVTVNILGWHYMDTTANIIP